MSKIVILGAGESAAPLYGKGRLIREIIEYRLALLLLIQRNVFDAT